MTIAELWQSRDPEDWRRALDAYWRRIKPENRALEERMNKLDLHRLRVMDARGWYDFLHDEYFPWKYTAPNRLATTRDQLETHAGDLRSLDAIRTLLLLQPTDVKAALKLAARIPGLGPAGASGLLALMYPHLFGTVDQFAVKALREVRGLADADAIAAMNPENLTVQNAVTLICVMQERAHENNALFNTAEWTPRKIDMVLWGYRGGDDPDAPPRMTDDDREHIEQLTEAIGECVVAIEQLRGQLTAIREANERGAEVLKVHGHQLDRLTAAIERFGVMLERVSGTRLSS